MKIDFSLYLKNGIITLDDVVGSDEETIMKTILDKIHNYKITRTTDGRYCTYVPDATKPNGRRQIRKPTKSELYTFLLNFYNVSSKTLTFQELYTEWIDYKRQFTTATNRRKSISPSTIRRYERDYEHLRTLDNKPIDQITTAFLEKALIEIIKRDDLKENNASNILGYIRQAFEYARRERYITEDPAELIDRRLILSMCSYQKPKTDEERAFTLNEMQALREAVKEHEKAHPGYMPDYAIELAMLTGMRVGEIAALSWESIDDNYIHIDYSEKRLDFEDRPCEIIISEPKNGKHRDIPLTSDIVELLDRIKAISGDSGFAFRVNGKRCQAHSISCAAARRGEEAELSNCSIHRIRRTVSSMLRTVLPVQAVANMLGHLERTNDEHYNYDTTEFNEKKTALERLSSNVIKIRRIS